MYKVNRFLCTSLAPDKYSYKHTQKETKASPLQVLCKEYIIKFQPLLTIENSFSYKFSNFRYWKCVPEWKIIRNRSQRELFMNIRRNVETLTSVWHESYINEIKLKFSSCILSIKKFPFSFSLLCFEIIFFNVQQFTVSRKLLYVIIKNIL